MKAVILLTLVTLGLSFSTQAKVVNQRTVTQSTIENTCSFTIGFSEDVRDCQAYYWRHYNQYYYSNSEAFYAGLNCSRQKSEIECQDQNAFECFEWGSPRAVVNVGSVDPGTGEGSIPVFLCSVTVRYKAYSN